MAESFLFSIAGIVLENIAPFVAEEVCVVFKSDLRELHDTISRIQVNLLDAERQQNKSESLRHCMRQLKDIFYDAEDVLDQFHCKALRRKIWKNPSISKRVRFSTATSFDSIPLVFSSKMGLKIKDINKRLRKVYAEWNNFNLGVEGDNRRVISREMRQTHSFVNDSDVIGRAEDKEEIVLRLMKEEPTETGNIPVIPIVGIGGLGKTMLTQLVYNDPRVVELFPSRIWVCVSEEFDLTRLLKEIIHSITRDKVKAFSLDALQTRLRDLLSHEKFLLVLDDVWNEDRQKWTELRDLLISLRSLPGSKIIVTTRSFTVASVMTGTSNSAYELRGLPFKDCMTLFIRWAFSNGDERRYPNLMRIGEEIVRNCRGIPLAVRTLGSLLFLKTEEWEWMSIRDSEIWALDQREDDILPVLKLSYDHLPSYLQRCLAFLSLYKKDHNYYSDDVITLWMANGLLEHREQHEEWENVGSRYLTELWSRCFIQDILGEGLYFSFKMHDLIHDLALGVTKTECRNLHCRTDPESIDEKVRHVSVLDQRIDFAKVLMKPKRARTVISQVGRWETTDTSFIDLCVSNFKYLRMLDLRGSEIKALPDSIGKWKHLRYLDLRECRIQKLPRSIYKLRSLLFLKVTGVPLKQLPDNMQSLISLVCLEISLGASHLEKIRPRCWSSLQYLSLFECFHLQDLFEGMEHLTSLRTLRLDSCDALKSLPRSLKFLTKLEHLEINDCQSCNIQMEPEKEDRDGDITLNLKTFSIWLLPASNDLPRLLLEGSASTLQRIKIVKCNKFQVLPEWLPNLTSLQKLEVLECPELSSLPEGMDRLTELTLLKISGCPMLSQRCQRGGADWHNIEHVLDVKLI